MAQGSSLSWSPLPTTQPSLCAQGPGLFGTVPLHLAHCPAHSTLRNERVTKHQWPVSVLVCFSLYRRLGRGGRQCGRREGRWRTDRTQSSMGTGLCMLLISLLTGAFFSSGLLSSQRPGSLVGLRVTLPASFQSLTPMQGAEVTCLMSCLEGEASVLS